MECENKSHTHKPIKETLEIINQKGLHARAASKFVSVAQTYQVTVEVEKAGIMVSGKSIMGLLMLAATKGSKISVKICGDDAKNAMQAIKELVATRFGEAE